ncbi:MAG: hypothetical protein HUU16_08795 [Candidatus Omnitrophica bacterium]|nr:hypothetical protein [Candidatus Omnitrophota bacterium]
MKQSIVSRTRVRFLLMGGLDLLTVLILAAAALPGICVILSWLGLPSSGPRAVAILWLFVFGAWFAIRLLTPAKALLSKHATLRLLERVHPEYREALTTLDYVEEHPREVEQFGYSANLLGALRAEADNLPDPSWERLGLCSASRKRELGIAVAAALAAVVLFSVAPETARGSFAGMIWGAERQPLTMARSLSIPEMVEVPLHHELTLPSPEGQLGSVVSAGELFGGAEVQVLARRRGTGWKPLGSIRPDTGPEGEPPIRVRVEGEMEIALLGKASRSNVCRVVPVPPPSLESLTVRVAPPEYTRHPAKVLSAPARIEAMSGSRMEWSWKTRAPVVAASLEILSLTGERRSITSLTMQATRDLSASIPLVGDGRLRLTMTDRFDQTALSPEVPCLAVEDQAPALEILAPSREVVLGKDLRVPTQVLATDDVTIAEATMVYRVENGLPGQVENRRAILVRMADSVPSASTVVLSPILDLNEAGLWPGDQVLYWFEATDWRGPDRPGKVGRSDTFTARFPTVEEALSDRSALRAETLDPLKDLLNDQREISRQFEEVRQDLDRNQKARPTAADKWEARKRMSETVRKQEDVQNKLAEIADKFEESLRRLEEENSISLRTLQKFERVQDLLDQLLSEESKQTLRELQETLRKLEENQLRPEDMEDTETNLAEFEKQLDRQLALLETMWLEQAAEQLQQEFEELAERQEELKEAVQDIHADKHPGEPTEELEADPDLEELAPEAVESFEEQMERLAEELKQAAEEREKASQLAETPKSPTGEQVADSSLPSETEEAKEPSDKQASPENEKPKDKEGASDEQGEKQEGQQPAQEEQPSASEQEPQEREKPEYAEQSQPESSSSPERNRRTEESEAATPEEQVLAERQEQLNEETKSALEELRRLRERAKEKEHQLAKQLDQIEKSEAAKSVQEQQESALSDMKQGQTGSAKKKQSKAKKDLDRLASAMQGCCGGGDKNMEEQIAKMREILERAFILSEESERNDEATARYKPMPSWPSQERMARLGREMNLFRQEASRLSGEFKAAAEKNPFADFTVIRRLDQAARNWRENTRVMEESAPHGVSVRSHQALGQVNLAIESLLQSLEQSESQCQSGAGGLESYFKSLKKMLAQQKQLNQDTQSLKEMMEQGNKNQRLPGQGDSSEGQGERGFSEQLKKMAEEQANIRRQLQQLEQQYRESRSRAGNLEGIGEMMEEVEKDLEHAKVDERVTDLQQKIEQRLLDAEKSLHEKGYRRERRALQAEGEGVEGALEESPPMELETKPDLARLLRENLEEVSPHWRDRVRSYYDQLLRMNP